MFRVRGLIRASAAPPARLRTIRLGLTRCFHAPPAPLALPFTAPTASAVASPAAATAVAAAVAAAPATNPRAKKSGGSRTSSFPPRAGEVTKKLRALNDAANARDIAGAHRIVTTANLIPLSTAKPDGVTPSTVVNAFNILLKAYNFAVRGVLSTHHLSLSAIITTKPNPAATAAVAPAGTASSAGAGSGAGSGDPIRELATAAVRDAWDRYVGHSPLLVPDEVSFNTVLSIFGQSGDTTNMMLWYDRFIEFGKTHPSVVPGTYTYSTLMNGFAKAGDVANMRKWSKLLHSVESKANPNAQAKTNSQANSRGERNEYSASLSIQMFARTGRTSELEALIRDLYASEDHTYAEFGVATAIIRAYSKLGRSKDVTAAWQRIRKRACEVVKAKGVTASPLHISVCNAMITHCRTSVPRNASRLDLARIESVIDRIVTEVFGIQDMMTATDEPVVNLKAARVNTSSLEVDIGARLVADLAFYNSVLMAYASCNAVSKMERFWSFIIRRAEASRAQKEKNNQPPIRLLVGGRYGNVSAIDILAPVNKWAVEMLANSMLQGYSHIAARHRSQAESTLDRMAAFFDSARRHPQIQLVPSHITWTNLMDGFASVCRIEYTDDSIGASAAAAAVAPSRSPLGTVLALFTSMMRHCEETKQPVAIHTIGVLVKAYNRSGRFRDVLNLYWLLHGVPIDPAPNKPVTEIDRASDALFQRLSESRMADGFASIQQQRTSAVSTNASSTLMYQSRSVSSDSAFLSNALDTVGYAHAAALRRQTSMQNAAASGVASTASRDPIYSDPTYWNAALLDRVWSTATRRGVPNANDYVSLLEAFARIDRPDRATEVLLTLLLPPPETDATAIKSLTAPAHTSATTSALPRPDPTTFDAARHRRRYAELLVYGGKAHAPSDPNARGAGIDLVIPRTVIEWITLVPARWRDMREQHKRHRNLDWYRQVESRVGQVESLFQAAAAERSPAARPRGRAPAARGRSNSESEFEASDSDTVDLRVLFNSDVQISAAQHPILLQLVIDVQRILHPHYSAADA